MNLELQVSYKPDGHYLTLRPENCTHENAAELLQELQHRARIVAQVTNKKLIIDMRQVGYIKSSTINAFLAANNILRDYDRRLVLKNIGDHSWENIQRLHLDQFFDRDEKSETHDSDCLTM